MHLVAKNDIDYLRYLFYLTKSFIYIIDWYEFEQLMDV